MRKYLGFLVAGAVMAILAGGCNSAKATDSTTTSPPSSVPALEGHSLADTSWVLTAYGDPASLKTIIAGTKVTLNFNAATDEISGNGGVNGFGGDAVRADNQIAFSGILHTLMASTDEATNHQESAYFALLATAQSVEFGTGTLTIHCQDGQVLIFKAA